MWGVLFLALLVGLAVPPTDDGKKASERSVAEAVAAIQRAFQKRHCDPAYLGQGSDAGSEERESFPIRVWLDGSGFFVETRDRDIWVPLVYEWGCFTKEGEAVLSGNAGLGQGHRDDEELKRELLGERYGLLRRDPDYVGTLVLGSCRDVPWRPCPEKSRIVEGLVEYCRTWLEDELEVAGRTEGGHVVLTVGPFSCESEEVSVLVEGGGGAALEPEVWDVEFLRGESCEDMSLVPTAFQLDYSWGMKFQEDEPEDLWPPPNSPLPLSREDVARLRAQGVVVRLYPKPKENGASAQASAGCGERQGEPRQ